MKKSIIKYICILLLGITFFSSCKKFVEVEAPKSQLLRKDLFSDGKAAETALLGLYAQLRDYGFQSPASIYGTSMALGYYADEIQYLTNTINDTYQFYHNYINSGNLRIKDFWIYSYQNIFYANSILEAEKESTVINKEIRDRLVGEALFVRALNHFYLTNTFGEVPYVVSTDFQKTTFQSKIAISEVYKLILDDLIIAEGLLKEVYPGTERIRPNKWVVKSLMARVYLYNKDWKNAEIKSSEVIAQTTLYKLEPDLNKVFLKESKEAIWQIKPATDGGNTIEGLQFVMTQDPRSVGFVLSDEFIQAHESGDLRKEKWLATYTLSGNSWLYPAKYKQKYATGTVSVEYSILFRLAEQHLIRAEAYAQQDKHELALIDLNKVRDRADLDDFESDVKEDILDAILKERRIELFLEYGHRFYDLKRTGNAAKYLKPIKREWTEDYLRWPIPLTELEANRGLLPQNPGYE